jgi:hypothetical protein
MHHKIYWVGLSVFFGLGLLLAVKGVITSNAANHNLQTTVKTNSKLAEQHFPPTALLVASTGANPGLLNEPGEPLASNSLLDSSVQGGSVFSCYSPGQTQTLCFTVYNASNDAEWITRTRMTFPQALGNWNVSCKSQDATDSQGYAVSMTCSNSYPYEVLYTDNDGDGWGEISNGSSWSFCVDASIPASYNGPRLIHWQLDGDKEGSEPHVVTGTISYDQCAPLMLEPDYLEIEGCNGLPQQHDFQVWNNTGNGGTFNFIYSIPTGNADFTGPTSTFLQSGEVMSFTTILAPSVFLKAGEKVTATLIVEGNTSADNSTLIKTITPFAGWLPATDSITPTMDNVVVWAAHADGGLWSIGGYGSKGAVQRYDPMSDSWSIHTPEISPTIEYPMDGCYGLDSQDHEVVVLFPDTTGVISTTLHRYDITDDHWDAPALPVGFPGARWSQDIVSLLSVTGENVCYLSGGATTTGGGNVNNLWEYHPDTNTSIFLGNFTHHFPEGFDFHASWYVPWIGAQGAICVAGGIDLNNVRLSSSQCYDRQAATFNAPNVDLGQLPEPWWGMADGWQVDHGHYQIWLANGVSQDGRLLPISAYADETTGGFVYGPEIPQALYRLEGDGFDGRFFTLGGSKGSFIYSPYTLYLAHCPECFYLNLPLVVRNFASP